MKIINERYYDLIFQGETNENRLIGSFETMAIAEEVRKRLPYKEYHYRISEQKMAIKVFSNADEYMQARRKAIKKTVEPIIDSSDL